MSYQNQNKSHDDLSNPNYIHAIEISENDNESIEVSEGFAKKWSKQGNVTSTEFTSVNGDGMPNTKICRHFNLIQYNYTELNPKAQMDVSDERGDPFVLI